MVAFLCVQDALWGPHSEVSARVYTCGFLRGNVKLTESAVSEPGERVSPSGSLWKGIYNAGPGLGILL